MVCVSHEYRPHCTAKFQVLRSDSVKLSVICSIIIIIIIIKAICNAQDPLRRPQMRCPAVSKYGCLYTMYHINNNVFSCVLKVVRLQSDIRNAVGKLFHTEGPETAKLLSP